MAYGRKFLSLIGMDGTAQRMRVWLYDGGTDGGNATLATITADDYLVENPARLTVGDVVIFRGSDNLIEVRRVTTASATSVITAAVTSAQLSGSATWNPGSLVAGQVATTTITVTGAALGDFVLASAPADLQGLLLTAYVSAADTVTLVLLNGGTLLEGSATLDPASLLPGESATLSITVTGAAVGDPVAAVLPGVDVNDLSVSATVTAADTVEVVITNNKPNLKGTVTADLASIADAESLEQAITVTGAALGDEVVNVGFSLDITQLSYSAAVTATDTVTVVLQNDSGGAIDLGSTTITCEVRDRSNARDLASSTWKARVFDESGTVDLASGTWRARVQKK